MLQNQYTRFTGYWMSELENDHRTLLPWITTYLKARKDPEIRTKILHDLGHEELKYRQIRAEKAGTAPSEAEPTDQTIRRIGPQELGHQLYLFEQLQFSRLALYLRILQPVKQIGYSAFIYRLTIDDLQHAISGDPPDLHDQRDDAPPSPEK